MLQEQVAIVTGGSRGVGKGIAQELRASGATVYVTGRTFGPDASADGCIPVVCDHRDDGQVRALFDRVRADHDCVDVLVNNVWGGYERMVENGASRGRFRSGNSRCGAGMRCSRPAFGRTTSRVRWQPGQWSNGDEG